MARILFFGITREITGAAELDYHASDLQELKEALEKDFDRLSVTCYRFAVNGAIRNDNTKLQDSDTVALLPPFAGG